MVVTTGAALGDVIFTLLFTAFFIWLQIFLSKRRNQWLGLILPTIYFIISLSSNVGVTYNFGAIHCSVPASLIPAVLSLNIPTYVLLVIYFSCRAKIKRRKELEKMNIQDLE